MAWSNYNNSYNSNGPRQNQNRNPRNNQGNYNGGKGDNRRQEQKPIVAKALPADYVDVAEKVIQEKGFLITTSKLRNLLSQFVDAYNEEILLTGERLQPASVNALTMARIRMLYEAGRERKVKDFIEGAELLEYLKGIGDSRVKMLDYYHYLEALVAYHKYYGGKEN